MPMMAISGKFRLLSVGFYTRAHSSCRVAEEGFHLIGEVNTVTPTFYKNKNFVQIGVHIKMHIKL
jgi:hypothetical protein